MHPERGRRFLSWCSEFSYTQHTMTRLISLNRYFLINVGAKKTPLLGAGWLIFGHFDCGLGLGGIWVNRPRGEIKWWNTLGKHAISGSISCDPTMIMLFKINLDLHSHLDKFRVVFQSLILPIGPFPLFASCLSPINYGKNIWVFFFRKGRYKKWEWAVEEIICLILCASHGWKHLNTRLWIKVCFERGIEAHRWAVVTRFQWEV